MRGGRGYSHRGSGPGRGSNSYGNRMNSNNRVGRYNNYNSGAPTSSGVGNGRYNTNYNNVGSGSGAGHYISRNRNKFNNNTGHHDSDHKRNYRNSSRDRSDDRKRSRQEDYRRNTSTGRNNRTPPPLPISVPNSSNYRIGNNTTYRESTVRSGDRQNGALRNRSPLSQNSKRPVRSTYMGRPQRGNINTSNRGLRLSMRGGHIMRRESTDLRVMRKKLIYAQQKDRARVLKIARLTSSLRRRRQARRSKSLNNSNSDDDDDANNDNGSETKKKGNSKGSVTKCPKSTEKDGVFEITNNKSFMDGEGENTTDIFTEGASNKKSAELSVEGHDQNDIKKTVTNASENQGKVKDEVNKNQKRENRKKLKDDDVIKEKSNKKLLNENETKSKSEGNTDSEESNIQTTKPRISRRDDMESRKGRFIKLTCIHCHTKCVTFKEYSQHLYSRTHKTAIHHISLRQRAHLLRLRARQRTAQREIEENCKEEYESKFCHLCRLHYRQPKAKHQLSEHHKTMKKFLMPYCSICHLAFKSPMLYETHRCSLEHIRNKARKRDSDSDNSGDEMREIDLNKFLTVDSVGEPDENEATRDAENHPIHTESVTHKDSIYETHHIGSQYIKKIETYYCELCNTYTPATRDLEDFASKHCKTRAHLKSFLRVKDDGIDKDDNDFTNNTIKTQYHHHEDQKETISGSAGDSHVEKDKEFDNLELESSTEMILDSDDKIWEDVDRNLGDLLLDARGNGEEEDESVLNIDIESEKHNMRNLNGINDEQKIHTDVNKAPLKSKIQLKSAPPKPAANDKLNKSD